MGELIDRRKAARRQVSKADDIIDEATKLHQMTFDELCTVHPDYDGDALTISAVALSELLTRIGYK